MTLLDSFIYCQYGILHPHPLPTHTLLIRCRNFFFLFFQTQEDPQQGPEVDIFVMNLENICLIILTSCLKIMKKQEFFFSLALSLILKYFFFSSISFSIHFPSVPDIFFFLNISFAAGFYSCLLHMTSCHISHRQTHTKKSNDIKNNHDNEKKLIKIKVWWWGENRSFNPK